MNFLELVRKRYSCKKYSSAPVEEHVLQSVLEAGRWAPTAKNTQAQHVYVAQSADAIRAVDSATPCRYGAPTVLIITYDRNKEYVYPDGDLCSGSEDAAIIAAHMMLAAAECGAATCWINHFRGHALSEALHIPQNEKIILLMDLGYAAEDFHPLPNHDSRRPLSETVSYI